MLVYLKTIEDKNWVGMFPGAPMRDIDANNYTGRRRLLVINPTVVEVNGRHIYTTLRK